MTMQTTQHRRNDPTPLDGQRLTPAHGASEGTPASERLDAACVAGER